MIVRWIKFTWNSGFGVTGLVVLAGCALFGLITAGHVPLIPFAFVLVIFLAVSIKNFVVSERAGAGKSRPRSRRRQNN